LGLVTGFVTSFCGGAFAGFFCDSGTGGGHLRSLCAAQENRKSHAGVAGGQIACEGSGCAKQISARLWQGKAATGPGNGCARQSHAPPVNRPADNRLNRCACAV